MIITTNVVGSSCDSGSNAGEARTSELILISIWCFGTRSGMKIIGEEL